MTPPGSYNRVPRATLDVVHGRVTGAELTLKAPFAVTSAAEEYTIEGEPCGPRGEGITSAVLDHNVGAGETVHMYLEYPFADKCTRRGLTVSVFYKSAGPEAKRSYGRTPGELLIGSAKIHLPMGDRAAERPRITRRRIRPLS